MREEKKLRFTQNHEWVEFSENKETAIVGITNFAQSSLGDIVFVELPEKDTEAKENEILGTLESVKSVSDIFSPLNGKVIEVNADLIDNPECINQDPYGKGWLFKIQLKSDNQSPLMSLEEYQKITN